MFRDRSVSCVFQVGDGLRRRCHSALGGVIGCVRLFASEKASDPGLLAQLVVDNGQFAAESPLASFCVEHHLVEYSDRAILKADGKYRDEGGDGDNSGVKHESRDDVPEFHLPKRKSRLSEAVQYGFTDKRR